MLIKKLKLNNFRNFCEGDIAINDGTTVFYGGVGQGKTNIIEAVFLLSIGRSHRTSETNHVISWGKNEAYVRGEGLNGCGSFSVAVKVSKEGKKIELNGENGKKNIDLIGGLRTVMFHSGDIDIVGGGPHSRRRFLDLALSQSSKNYVYNLRDYYKVLKQRNASLVKFSKKDLENWDEQLARIGSWLTKIRRGVVGELNTAAAHFVSLMAGENNQLAIKYSASGDEDRSEFLRKLEASRESDLLRGTTSVGPHRDDLKISLNGVDARHFSSSGEKKTIALALKLAEVEFITTVTGEKPIMLMDDLFSTLDYNRSKALLGVVGEGAQCIITLTDKDLLKDGMHDNAMSYEVRNGQILQPL
jgi:DNA replication and repair protein RecF